MLSTLALRALPVLALFAVSCVEANAQTRPDAGPARRQDSGVRPRIAFGRADIRRALFLRSDGGIPAAFWREPQVNAQDILAQADGISAATPQQHTPVSGDGTGTIARARSDGRFDDPENLAGVPLPDARSWLFVAGSWALRCLERAPEVDAFSLPVRFTILRDGSVSSVSAQGATDAAQRCLAEGFTHARFHPRTELVVLVARYRYTVRWSRPRVARDGGVADSGRDW